MEYRKLISFGKNSYVISLPKAWVRQNKLNKGDLVYVDESQNSLILQASQKKDQEDKEITILVDGKDLKRVKREIIGAYIHNFKTIKLLGEEIKQKAPEIQDSIQKMVALEIIEQDSKKIVAKDFLNLNDISMEQIIKKMEVISRSMLSDCKEMFDHDNYDTIYHRDQDINKFRFLIYRIVWYGLDNPTNMLRKFNLKPIDLFNEWSISYYVEQVGDCIKRIARAMKEIDLPVKKKKEFVQLLGEVELCYGKVLKAYHTKNIGMAHEVVDERAILIEKVEAYFAENRSTTGIGNLVHNTEALIVSLAAIARVVYQGMSDE